MDRLIIVCITTAILQSVFNVVYIQYYSGRLPVDEAQDNLADIPQFYSLNTCTS